MRWASSSKPGYLRAARTFATAAITSLACLAGVLAMAGQTRQAPSRVVDLTPDGDRYGTIVATAPVGEKGLWPHHTEHELGASKTLFANGFAANRNLVFDLHDPRRPRVTERFDGVGGPSFLHSFARLSNGHVLGTFQAHGPDNVSPGGIAEMDERGRLVAIRCRSIGCRTSH